MKKITLNPEQRQNLKNIMELGSAKSISELFDIKKVCDKLESPGFQYVEKDGQKELTGEPVDLSFEDSEFRTLKTRFNAVNDWAPARREEILILHDLIEEVSKQA